MKYRNFIWGLILVMIGVLFILRNVGIMSFSWFSVLRLWPLALVLIGIAILPVKDGVKAVLSIITLLIAVAFIIAFPNYHWNWSWNRFDHRWNDRDRTEQIDYDQRIYEPFDTSTLEVLLDFDAAVGNFTIQDPTSELFEFDKEGGVGRYNYSVKNLGERKEVKFELDKPRILGRNFKNNVEIRLNSEPVWDLKVDVGAADIDMDLSEFKVRKIDIDGGASSVFVKVGELLDETDITIDSGASSLEIRVPENFACEVDLNTVLSSKNLEGFVEVGDGTYVTPDFSEAGRNVVIRVEAAVSSLKVVRY